MELLANKKRSHVLINAKKFVSIISTVCMAAFISYYYPDIYANDTINTVQTSVLAHRAAGKSSLLYDENTFEAAVYGLSIVDGIEVDIQFSKDGTIWLAHDAFLPLCGDKTLRYFFETEDRRILELYNCKDADYRLTTLEEVLAMMSLYNPYKKISLDAKSWTYAAKSRIQHDSDMISMADEIIRLTYKYNLQNRVVVESDNISFLKHIQNNSSGIDSYLLAYTNFEKAVQQAVDSGFRGISFDFHIMKDFNNTHMTMLRENGLKIHLWTINEESDLKKAFSLHPDFIQTDNIEYFKNQNN
jgi:glycerophosphoryl diester phosphodiesterase